MEKGSKSGSSFSEVHNSFFEHCEKTRIKKNAEWCIVAIDIEHFKLFNEVYGREKGDILLTDFWTYLKHYEEKMRCVSSYFGQDDFAVFMEYDSEAIQNMYLQLRDVVNQIGRSVGFLPAIGVYKLHENDSINLSVYDKAVSAMLEAKKHRTERVKEYDLAAHEKEKREYEILVDLKKAMDQDEITFYLQPQCRISTEKIVGAEALARWVRKDGKMVPPGIFIPVLEKHGFIADFDQIVWERVCKWIRSLLDRSITPIPVSLNVSQIDILTMNVVEVLCSLCEKYEIPTKLLKVEITESAYSEETAKIDSLVKALREKGFITMMDDFGAGYSSLNMLENINVDVLKLDMIFVKEANLQSRKGITIIESIVNMAKMMSLPIVVEGVETEEQVKFLKNIGCRYAQGYYYYKPLPVAEFEKLLCEGDNLDHRGFLNKRNEEIHVREFLDENTFTDTILNNILGPVAFYTLEGKDLTINRFNEQFYLAISDASMEERQEAIQNYVVKEDWPYLYRALEEAVKNIATGGICEIRFYKSDGSVFWFRMHLFYLRNDNEKKIFYGQVQDVTEARQQSIQFFEVLREQSDVAMMINLGQNTIQYVTGINTMDQIGLPSMDLDFSIARTSEVRIESEEDRKKFRDFFDVERLKEAHRKAIYHEKMTVGFRLTSVVEPVEFSTYYIRHSKDQDLNVYSFAKRISK